MKLRNEHCEYSVTKEKYVVKLYAGRQSDTRYVEAYGMNITEHGDLKFYDNFGNIYLVIASGIWTVACHEKDDDKN